MPRATAGRRRQVIRRTHDLPGAGGRPPGGGARAGFSWLSAASRRKALRTTGHAPVRHPHPDAVHAGHARQPGAIAADGAFDTSAWNEGLTEIVRTRRSFVSRVGPVGPQ